MMSSGPIDLHFYKQDDNASLHTMKATGVPHLIDFGVMSAEHDVSAKPLSREGAHEMTSGSLQTEWVTCDFPLNQFDTTACPFVEKGHWLTASSFIFPPFHLIINVLVFLFKCIHVDVKYIYTWDRCVYVYT